ncbi:hypothetical protein AX14_000452 [Amanita brunnescens Koide BX004]|nr:hypothetical protein AX14_000452 [Amanita brunnescens Koide BX004]
MHDMNEKSDIRRRKRAGHLGSLVIGPRSPMPSGHSTLPISAQQVEGGEIEGSNKISHARKGSATGLESLIVRLALDYLRQNGWATVHIHSPDPRQCVISACRKITGTWS